MRHMECLAVGVHAVGVYEGLAVGVYEVYAMHFLCDGCLFCNDGHSTFVREE